MEPQEYAGTQDLGSFGSHRLVMLRLYNYLTSPSLCIHLKNGDNINMFLKYFPPDN